MYKIPHISIPPMIPLNALTETETKWVIKELKGPHEEFCIDCVKPIIMGRSSSNCNLVFPADASGVSKVHCEISPSEEGVLLKDLDSSYGTFLGNGCPVNAGEPILLTHGDIFYLASSAYMFQVK